MIPIVKIALLHFFKSGAIKIAMPKFNQISSEMAILAYLAKLKDQPTNQPIISYSMNGLNSPFF
jgi:hypothetical protein